MRSFFAFHKEAVDLIRRNFKGAFSSCAVVLSLPLVARQIVIGRLIAPLLDVLIWPFNDAFMCTFVDAARGKKVQFLKTTWTEGKKKYVPFIVLELIMHIMTVMVKVVLSIFPVLRWFGKSLMIIRPQYLVIPRYLIHDNHELGIGEAVKKAWQMVKKYPFMFLVLSCKFLFWVLFQPIIGVLRLFSLIPMFTMVLVPIIIILKLLKSVMYSVYISAVLSLYYLDLIAEEEPALVTEIVSDVEAQTIPAVEVVLN